MRNLAVKIPDDLLAKLSDESRRRGIGRSELMRQALRSILEGKGGDRSSFTARATDLAGRVSGPVDLSHAPRHLKSYGR